MPHPRIRREWFSFLGMRGRQRVSGAGHGFAPTARDAGAFGIDSGTCLILRSAAKRRVSKDGYEHRICCPSFETAAAQPPQDEVVGVNLERRLKRRNSHHVGADPSQRLGMTPTGRHSHSIISGPNSPLKLLIKKIRAARYTVNQPVKSERS